MKFVTIFWCNFWRVMAVGLQMDQTVQELLETRIGRGSFKFNSSTKQAKSQPHF